MKKRVVRFLVAMVGVCSLAGCGKKNVAAPNVQEALTQVTTEAPTEAKKVTVEDIVNALMEESQKQLVMLDEAFADDLLSKDEVFQFVELIPEGVMTMNFNADGSMLVKENGNEMAMSGSADGKMELTFDTKDHELQADVQAKVAYDVPMLGASGNQGYNFTFYLLNEDGNYYLYTQMGSTTPKRTLLGNLDEVLPTEVGFEEMKKELGGKSFSELTKELMTEEMWKGYSLDEEMVTFNGKECYQLQYHMTGTQMIEMMKNSFAAMELEEGVTFEDALTQELAPGYTLEDFYNEFDLTYYYYLTKDDYKTVYVKCDMADMLNRVVGSIAKIALAEYSNQSEIPYEVSVDVKKCYFDCAFEEKEVDVSYEGAYEEDTESDISFGDPGIMTIQ